MIQPVRQALTALDPALPFVEIRTLAEEVDADYGGRATHGDAGLAFRQPSPYCSLP